MKIDRIILHDTIPDVFRSDAAERGRCEHSDVWLSDVVFERSSNYLIEAESGRGKSSLCAFIMGLRNDYVGSIWLDDTEVRAMSHAALSEMRRTGIAYLPQDMRLFPELTVLENINLKNRLTGHCTADDIARMLDVMEIPCKADSPAARLSIGQQQRVAIVRALCQPFSFLLLDEPVSHLDPRTNAIVGRLVAEEAARQGASVISTSVGNHLDMPGEVQRLHL